MDEFSVRDIEPHGTEVTLVKAMSNGQPAG
jgi:hypothetical protein